MRGSRARRRRVRSMRSKAEKGLKRSSLPPLPRWGSRMGKSRRLRYRADDRETPGRMAGFAQKVRGTYLIAMSALPNPKEFELDPYSARVSHVYEVVGPAVASIVALRPDGQPAGQGSGVVFTPDGYVLTNSDVAGGQKEFQVTLPSGLKTSARMVGDDPETDLAVLRMSANGLDY